MQQATFGAGCFWGVEARFSQVDGVLETAVGYMGGHTDNPDYSAVCTDTTGHAEVVHLSYDPQRVAYDDLLELFWRSHDPTTPNRQGPDVGSQYRSVVFYHSEEQRARAEDVLQRLVQQGTWAAPVVTEIVPAGAFYRAEEYHQKYLAKRGMSSCQL
ncbi:peptide-methionine (S)-S-oxide reductase MsrA [Motiliproteus sp. SC1-56]|uniref:peptide-methionine (S)-S-oxide reductase MsrA n=1 Tax=Motiliproteus sp. SC1-56 TaxID=2799565 RepID=UPI001A90194A|nr:peptide-methionine (S)-S-oxide reductase MsrA [Motiliproteus sp. SC1-56]